MSAPVALIANAQRMLVDANTVLLDLAEQIGKGERRGRDGETVVLIVKISERLSGAVGLLFDSEGPAPMLADA